MRALITGGTGFIGSQLTLKCLNKGMEVRVFGQENTPAEKNNREIITEQGAEVILGAITDQGLFPKIVQDIDVIFHLAATQHEMNIPDHVFYQVNVEGTENLLRNAILAGVKRFLHGSTIGVYGDMQGQIDETTPTNPDNIYGRTKLEGEKVVLNCKHEIPVTIIRICEVYGPSDRRLLKLFKAVKKNMFPIIGNGKNLHHLIYVDDLIDGFFKAMNTDKAVGEIFVLGGREVLTTREIVETVARVLGADPPKLQLPLAPFLWAAVAMELTMRPLGIQPLLHRRRMDFFRKSYRFSNDKASKVLGFDAQYTFEQGARITAKWYEEQGLL
jgi:dihydroflavonol-4-reductase